MITKIYMIAAMFAAPGAAFAQDINFFDIHQAGGTTFIGIFQIGANPTAVVNENGSNNILAISQFGSHSTTATVNQSGTNNFLIASEFGSYNRASFNQNGINNYSSLNQGGTFNFSDITQTQPR